MSRRRLVLTTVGRAWGKAVVAMVASTVLLNAIGLGEVSGYATIPGLYMALSPPVGDLARRVWVVVIATVALALLDVLGGELSRSTLLIALGLFGGGFAAGLLPGFGPAAAGMQLPLMMGFAYSVSQPLSDASAGDRGLAVLAALPIYVLAAAITFQGDRLLGLRLACAKTLASLGAPGLAEGKLPLGPVRGVPAALVLGGAVQEAALTATAPEETGHAKAIAARLLGRPAPPAGAPLGEAVALHEADLAARVLTGEPGAALPARPPVPSPRGWPRRSIRATGCSGGRCGSGSRRASPGSRRPR